LVEFLTDVQIEELVADRRALERKYPNLPEPKAVAVLRKLQNLSAMGLAHTGSVNVPSIDQRKAQALANSLSAA